MRIGLVQTQRLGDAIIALPIAQWLIARGHEVFWPINVHYLAPLHLADPTINFLPIQPGGTMDDYYYDEPIRLLREAGCKEIFPLYLYPDKYVDKRLESCLKFDEYKYALTGVPFDEKWKLRLVRDKGRELALHASLGIRGEYVLVHDQGSETGVTVTLPKAWHDRYQIVTIDRRTDNLFDWIYTIEQAAKRVMLDSSFANLTDQLNIAGDNHLIFRSVISSTPVFRNGWQFAWPNDPIIERPALSLSAVEQLRQRSITR